MSARPVRAVASRRRARVVAALAVIVGLLLLAGLLDFALAYGRIHPGVSIGGRDMGRVTRADAVARLTEAAEQSARRQITLVRGSERWPVSPRDLGTRVDVQGSVADAFARGRSGNPVSRLIERLSLYFSQRDVPVRGTVDTERLDALIGGVAAAVDSPPVNAGLKVKDGSIQVVEGRDGLVVDRPLLRDRLKVLVFSLHSTELEVPMRVALPAIKAADTREAEQQVRVMISADVRLEHGGKVWTVSRSAIEDYLDFTTAGAGDRQKLVPLLSATKAAPFLEEVARAVKKEAKNATWETDGETAVVVPAQNGQDLDKSKTASALTRAALSSTDRVAKAEVSVTEPERTTAEAKAMGIERKLGAYNTEFSGSENRRDNIQHAAKLISGTLLAPGEEFDFDRVVGKRTRENGFKTAPAIINGQLEDTLGGGICQVATTLFNAAFFAGLDITARTNHSIYISHYPKGRDATVSWGGPALRFRNDTSAYVLIRAAASRSSLTFVIYGKPQGRKVTYTTSGWYNVQPPTDRRIKTDKLPLGETRTIDDGQTGRQIKVVRKVTQEGRLIHEDVFISSYPMRPRTVEEGTKAPVTTTTTTSETTTTTETPSSSTSTTAS